MKYFKQVNGDRINDTLVMQSRAQFLRTARR